jgi:hypothetical protein
MRQSRDCAFLRLPVASKNSRKNSLYLLHALENIEQRTIGRSVLVWHRLQVIHYVSGSVFRVGWLRRASNLENEKIDGSAEVDRFVTTSRHRPQSDIPQRSGSSKMASSSAVGSAFMASKASSLAASSPSAILWRFGVADEVMLDNLVYFAQSGAQSRLRSGVAERCGTCPCRKLKLEHIDGVARPRSATNARPLCA